MADSTIRIVLIFFLMPVRGMEGFLFIMVLSNIFTSFLNLHRLLTVTGVKLAWGQWILKPILAITTAGAVALLLGRFLPFVHLYARLADRRHRMPVPDLRNPAPLLGCITRDDLHRSVSH